MSRKEVIRFDDKDEFCDRLRGTSPHLRIIVLPCGSINTVPEGVTVYNALYRASATVGDKRMVLCRSFGRIVRDEARDPAIEQEKINQLTLENAQQETGAIFCSERHIRARFEEDNDRREKETKAFWDNKTQ